MLAPPVLWREMDELIFDQIQQKRSLQNEIDNVVNEKHEALSNLQHNVFSRLPEQKIETVKPTFEIYRNSNSRDFGMER